MDIVLPGIEQRFCCRHLYANFAKVHKGLQLKQLMWEAAKATNLPAFEDHMKEILSVDKAAHAYLEALPKGWWCRHAFSPYPKCDLLSNNMSEAFNSYILDARDKPIVTLLEMIRVNLMTRMRIKYRRMVNFEGVICPRIQTKLENIKLQIGNCLPRFSGGREFEVACYPDRFVVDLNKRTCTCRKWDITGLPCNHAVSCIFHSKEKVESYVDDCYTVETYLKIYEPMIHPMNGPKLWPKTSYDDIKPPYYRRKAGRPKKKRRKGQDEVPNPNKLSRRNTSVQCRNCWNWGHNKRTCKRPPCPKPTRGSSYTSTAASNDAGPSSAPIVSGSSSTSVAASNGARPSTAPPSSTTVRIGPRRKHVASGGRTRLIIPSIQQPVRAKVPTRNISRFRRKDKGNNGGELDKNKGNNAAANESNKKNGGVATTGPNHNNTGRGEAAIRPFMWRGSMCFTRGNNGEGSSGNGNGNDTVGQ